MDWSVQQHVESCAPSHLQLPTGSKVPINYSSINPTAAVKMQEVFGLADTPVLGGDRSRVPLVLELLSPAGRPLQVLRSFNLNQVVGCDCMGGRASYYNVCVQALGGSEVAPCAVPVDVRGRSASATIRLLPSQHRTAGTGA